MSGTEKNFPSNRLLMQLGAILLLFGLLTGLVIPLAQLPRMALASHLEAIINGILLIVIGLIWDRLTLSARQRIVAFWTIVYAAFANWIVTLFSAFTSAAAMMPLAGGGSTGASMHELFVMVLLISLTLAILIGVGMIVYGLRTLKPA